MREWDKLGKMVRGREYREGEIGERGREDRVWEG